MRGYKDIFDVTLPKIKKGIISPHEAQEPISDYKYAKDYHVGLDARLLFKTFGAIGD